MTKSGPLEFKEEPAYLMFARANVKDKIASSPVIVESLLNRIDRLERMIELGHGKDDNG